MSHKLLIPIWGLVILSVSFFTVPLTAVTMPGLSSPAEGRLFQGEVVDTMNASGYTYMLLASNNKQTWVAIPEASVMKGEVVQYQEGMVMENFTSKSLNKTFETIIFSAGLQNQAVASPHKKTADPDDSFAAALQAERGASSVQQAAPIGGVSSGSAGAVVPFEELTVEKSSAENGYTIEEIFGNAKDLSGKKVQIRGKVVKFSPMIMGKNWVHLQDGTGNPMKNSHDLVFTTNESVEVNTVVTFEGILSANKDFGAGYKYEAIVEQANVIK